MDKYYVVSRFYNNGNVSWEVIKEKNYQGQKRERTEKYDQYIDECKSLNEVNELFKELNKLIEELKE